MIRILSKLLTWLAIIFVSISFCSCENDKEQEPEEIRNQREYGYRQMDKVIKSTLNCYDIREEEDPFPNTPERFYTDYNRRELRCERHGLLMDTWYNDQTGESCLHALYELKPCSLVTYTTWQQKYTYYAKRISDGFEFILEFEDYGLDGFLLSSEINNHKSVFSSLGKIHAATQLVRENYRTSLYPIDERYWMMNNSPKAEEVADVYDITDLQSGISIYDPDSLGYPNKTKFDTDGDWMTVSTFHYKNRRLIPCGKLYFTIDEIHYGEVMLSQYAQIEGEKIRDAILKLKSSEDKTISRIYKFY